MGLEYRQTALAGGLELRVSADGSRGRVVADVMKYNVVDDYRTTFRHGCFTESLETRLPRILWSHNPHDPIGSWDDADDRPDRLRLAGRLDLEMIEGSTMPAVPSAHRAYAQLRSGTVDQFSVGFLRQGEERNSPRQGVTAITKALLDEASPVLVASVPGAQLVSVRSAAGLYTPPTRGLRLFPPSARETRSRG